MKKLTAIIMILALTLSLCNSLSIAQETDVEITQSVENIESESTIKEDTNNYKDDSQVDLKKVEDINVEETKQEMTLEEMQTTVCNFIEKIVRSSDEIEGFTLKWIGRSEKSFTFWGNKICESNDQEYFGEKLKKVYELILENGEQIEEDLYIQEQDRLLNGSDEVNQYIELKMELNTHSFEVYGYDEYLNIKIVGIENELLQNQYYKISNSQELVDYIADLTDRPVKKAEDKNFEALLDWENKTINGEHFSNIEKLSFDFKVTEENCKSIIYQVAEVGDTVSCEIRHIEVPFEMRLNGRTHILLFNLGGSKKDLTFAIDQSHFGNTYIIADQQDAIYSNDQFIYTKILKNRTWSLLLNGTFDENDEIKTLSILMEYSPIFPTADKKSCLIWCDNIEYEYYLREPMSENDMNFYYMYTYHDRDIGEKRNEAVRKRKALNLPLGTFRVNALAHAEIEIDDSIAPQWYKELGRNVNLMILSVTRETKLGRETAPVIRFRGAGGDIWFYCTEVDNLLAHEGDKQYKWNAVVSFDSIRAKEDHTIDGELTGRSFCTDDDVPVLKGFEFDIGGSVIEFKINDLNIIFCDNFTNDLLYDMDYYYEDDYWDGLEDFMSEMKYGSVYNY